MASTGWGRWEEVLARLKKPQTPIDRLKDALSEAKPLALQYHLNLRESRLRDRLIIDFMRVDEDGRTRAVALEDGDPSGLDGVDQDLVGLLLGASGEPRNWGHHAPDQGLIRSSVRPSLYQLLLPQLVRTGRFYGDPQLPGSSLTGPLQFAGKTPFEIQLVVRPIEERASYRMSGVLRRHRERHALESADLLLSDGLALFDDRLLLVRAGEELEWALRLKRFGAIEFPEERKDGFLMELARVPDLPPVELPPELHWSQVSIEPRPKLVFTLEGEEEDVDEGQPSSASPFTRAKVLFDYLGTLVPVNARETAVVDEHGRRFFRRDFRGERAHLERLRPLNVGLEGGGTGELRLPKRTLAECVRALVEAGWAVEADGHRVRVGGVLRAKVKSGIDWFDLDAFVDYPVPDDEPTEEDGGAEGPNADRSRALVDGEGGGEKKASVRLPELLRAVKAGRQLVPLQDGSRGLIPEWMPRYAALFGIGKVAAGKLRFDSTQAGIIDVLLVGHEEVDVDVKFQRLKEQLRGARAASSISEPPGFRGKLRDYQRAGVAWMHFLETHGYGGCLADDMGLGKTVQVLFVLQARHPPGQARAPSLVVVPKSLIHNWVAEAEKFTALRVLDYTGARRIEHRDRFDAYDLVVTTYGTLRQEILRFTEIRFTSLVLDEAQAIKNPRSQAAKACRLIQADNRLAISGTPIENGLEELWSLFEFLNPGMLGSLSEFAAPGRDKDDAWLDSMSRALKPFMLRRKKDQVLKELPEKTEQIWEVPLGDEERRRYEELRGYYRRALKGVLDGHENLAEARIHVLEALLRLRQAACHPGLLDPARMDEGSAKVDALFEKLEQVVPQGHKVLVFSQFTTLLEIVRRRLEKAEITYAYLDGATPDRRRTVSTFTDDPDCAVFLISLKAGGCGLNLTQSDYVFILDPWWNPAIEAQAVDRAHRMGQKNRVFAYRMVSKNTVEEKIVALQAEKRRIADAVVTAEAGPLQSLEPEDLKELLGQG